MFLERVTATENLAYLRRTTNPWNQRWASYQDLLRGTEPIFRRYGLVLEKQPNLHTEFAMMDAFMLRVGALGIMLINEALAANPKDEAARAARLGMRDGLTKMLSGIELFHPRYHVSGNGGSFHCSQVDGGHLA